MTLVDEAVAARTPIGSVLADGIDVVSISQTVLFQKYVRLVLPVDGFVFWVNAAKIKPSALFDLGKFGAFRFGAAPALAPSANGLLVEGSLHYATTREQNEDATYAVNRVIFSAKEEIADLNAVGSSVLYLGSVTDPAVGGSPNVPVRFAFSDRGSFYRQSDLYHYVGNAVYSTLASQIVDDPAAFDSRNRVVSNSLPAWLAMPAYAPPWPIPTPAPSFALYPSFLTPVNEAPAYAGVHVYDTRATQTAPFLDATLNHWQLAEERVRVSLWGVRNDAALDFQDFVNQYSLDTGLFGIKSMTVVADEKRPQVELAALAMRKTFEWEVSYDQRRIADVARQLIETVQIAIIPGP